MDIAATPVLGASGANALPKMPGLELPDGGHTSTMGVGRFDHAMYSTVARTDTTAVQAGANISLSDVSRLDHAVYSEAGRLDMVAVPIGSPVLSALGKPLDGINKHVMKSLDNIKKLSDKGTAITPGDLIKCSVDAQVFSLNCTLVSNVATKSSDGVSQLFKQQA